MRKKVSLTMVKNEAAIIESFIRYNSKFLDCMVIIDNGCTDGTMRIIDNLKDEGYNLIYYNESTVSYEQIIIENKYMFKIIEEMDSDIIIPLDADEFITGDNNPNDILERIPLDRVYYMKWRTYVITKSDSREEKFIPSRIRHYRLDSNERCEEGKEVTKVIIPTKLAQTFDIVMNAGHHSVMEKKGLLIEKITELKIAHFPTTSKEQFESDIYCSYTNYITWLTRSENDGKHKNRMYHRIRNTEYDIEDLSPTYGFSDMEFKQFNINEDVIYGPINLSHCNNIEIKYSELSKVNTFDNVLNLAQTLAIRCYNLERDKQSQLGVPKILVYGTGQRAKNLLYGINKNCVDIRAYIDSDARKEYTIFQERLIIFPERIKFFIYDKIVIASTFYDEIYDVLIKHGISPDKIVDKNWLVRLCVSAR